jgi:hypothetical protein
MPEQSTSTLTVDVRPGEGLELAVTLVRIDVVRKSGQVTRLRVTAPREVRIQRLGEDSRSGMFESVPSTAR